MTSHVTLLLLLLLLLELPVYSVAQCGAVAAVQDALTYTSTRRECGNGTAASAELQLTSAPVTDFHVMSTILFYPPDSRPVTSCSNLTITWRAPTADQVDGYQIRLTEYKQSTKIGAPPKEEISVVCICYEPKSKSHLPGTPDPNQKFVFSLTVPPATYLVQVFSVSSRSPVAGSRFLVPQALVTVKSQNYGKQTDTSQFVTDIVVQYNACNQLASVSFELAPPSYAFVKYRIKLIFPLKLVEQPGQQEKFFPANSNATHGYVVFDNVTAVETYTAAIRPCFYCRDANANHDHRKETAIPLWSTAFSTFTVSSAECELIKAPALTTNHIIAVVLGTSSALLIILLAVHIYKYIKAWRDVLPSNRVLLIYDEDDQPHRQAVEALDKFLRWHCNLSITADFTDPDAVRASKSRFVEDSFQNTDKVLVIVSEGLCVRLKMLRSGEEGNSSVDLLATNVLLLNRLRLQFVNNPNFDTNRLVLARFDNDRIILNKSLDIFCGMTVHELLGSINDVVFSLHGIPRRYRLPCLLPMWYRNSLRSSEEGKKLSRAVECINCEQQVAPLLHEDSVSDTDCREMDPLPSNEILDSGLGTDNVHVQVHLPGPPQGRGERPGTLRPCDDEELQVKPLLRTEFTDVRSIEMELLVHDYFRKLNEDYDGTSVCSDI